MRVGFELRERQCADQRGTAIEHVLDDDASDRHVRQWQLRQQMGGQDREQVEPPVPPWRQQQCAHDQCIGQPQRGYGCVRKGQRLAELRRRVVAGGERQRAQRVVDRGSS